MNVENLIDSFSEFKDVKNIDRETMMSILEDVFKTVLEKKYDGAEIFDVIINVDKGDLEIWKNREVVADDKLEDENTQIKLSDALMIEDDYEVGEEVSEQVSFDSEFGRRQVLSIRQNLVGRINDLHRDEILKNYQNRIGEIVNAEVYQIWKNEILLQDDEGNDLILPKSEQIPRDFFKKGDSVKTVVKSAELKNNKSHIVLSRIAPEFIERLFEMEVPEVFDGIITIKKVVRMPGERAKVMVESYDDRIDPVGACVGVKGSRIHGIVRELRNENIASKAAELAKEAEIRNAIITIQRNAYDPEKGLIADGRDMGTVIFPEASLKVFLQASPEVRAERRANQLKEKGMSVIMHDLLELIKQRDEEDMNRKISPLKPAEGSLIIDTSNLSIQEVEEKVMENYKKL